MSLRKFSTGVVMLVTGITANAKKTDDFAHPQIQICSEKATKILNEWQAQAPWHRGIGPTPGSSLYRAPTKDFGKWIEIITSPKQTKLSLIAEDGIVTIKWRSGCTGAAHFQPLKTGRSRITKPESFKEFAILNDAKLRGLFRDGKSGVVYLWSPHKPISIFGLREARSAAKKLNIPLIAVADPNSDPDAIRREAQFVGLEAKDIYIFDSMDLQMRGLRLHFPSLITFQGGGYSSPVRKGYESAETYVNYFSEHTNLHATQAVPNADESTKSKLVSEKSG